MTLLLVCDCGSQHILGHSKCFVLLR